MNNPSNISVDGLPLDIVKSIEAMISTVRNELEKETTQPDQIEKKYPWTVIEGVNIDQVKREDFYDNL